MKIIRYIRDTRMHDMKQGRAESLVLAAARTEAIEENYCSVHADFKKSIDVLALVNQIWLLMSVSQTSWHKMLPPYFSSWSYLGEIIINKTLKNPLAMLAGANPEVTLSSGSLTFTRESTGRSCVNS